MPAAFCMQKKRGEMAKPSLLGWWYARDRPQKTDTDARERPQIRRAGETAGGTTNEQTHGV